MPAEGVALITVGSSHLRRSGLKGGLSTLNDLIMKNNPYAVVSCYLIPHVVKLKTKNSHNNLYAD